LLLNGGLGCINQGDLLAFEEGNARRDGSFHVFVGYPQGLAVSGEFQAAGVEVDDDADDVAPSGARGVLLDDAFVDLLPRQAHHPPLPRRVPQVRLHVGGLGSYSHDYLPGVR